MHHAEEEEQTETDVEEDSEEMEDADDESSEVDSTSDVDRDCWKFLFDDIREKEPDFLLETGKLRNDLLSIGASLEHAQVRSKCLYFKLLAKELREGLLNLVLDMKILRKDSIYEQLMQDVKESEMPFAEAFRMAWRKQKDTIIEEILRPSFPGKPADGGDDESVSDDASTSDS